MSELKGIEGRNAYKNVGTGLAVGLTRVIDAVRAACVSQGVGARLTLESERLALRPLRAIVSTKPNAHLALSIVAERDGNAPMGERGVLRHVT